MNPSPAEKPSEITRYSPAEWSHNWDVVPCVSGSYVRYSDHAESLSRLAGELARVEDAKDEAVRAAFRDGPITADGVKITEGMSVYWWCAAQRVERGIWPASLPFAMPHRCYSTREAAQAARTEVGRG